MKYLLLFPELFLTAGDDVIFFNVKSSDTSAMNRSLHLSFVLSGIPKS